MDAFYEYVEKLRVSQEQKVEALRVDYQNQFDALSAILEFGEEMRAHDMVFRVARVEISAHCPGVQISVTHEHSLEMRIYRVKGTIEAYRVDIRGMGTKDFPLSNGTQAVCTYLGEAIVALRAEQEFRDWQQATFRF